MVVITVQQWTWKTKKLKIVIFKKGIRIMKEVAKQGVSNSQNL